MFFGKVTANRIQHHLDVHTIQFEQQQQQQVAHDDSAAAEPVESPFAMTGLYDLIPGSDPSPLRIDTGTEQDRA